MSRSNKYDGYATYSTYNSGEKPASNAPVTERFSNAPPPPQTFPTPPQNQHPPVYNGSQIRSNPQNINENRNIYQTQSPIPPTNGGSSQSSQSSHRVYKMSTDKLYDVLTNKPMFFSQQTGQPLRVFIKVFTDWCKPCKKIEPEIKAISINYPSVFFFEVNGDELMQNEKLASLLKVSSVPSFFGFVAMQDSSGDRYIKQVGFMTGVDMTEIKTLCDKIQNS